MLDNILPLHPKLVHFPIALLTTALVFELLSRCLRKNSFSQTAVFIYVFATFLTPLVVWSGWWEQTRLQLHHPVLTQHRTFALLTMWTALVSLPILWFLYRRSVKAFKTFFLILLIALTITVSITGYFGGEMVYEYGVGVER
ncbi:MAG: hypothetical protein HY209_07705 [Candidatus Omnitrophica bacterium]|nr:hypothetical protein [Candidatus Omnitrophota bacterium]